MDFSFSTIGKYWDILSQYVNPMTILMWALIGGIVGFLLMLVIQIVFRKNILVQRKHWILKIFAYSYMIFLPLFAGFCFTQWFALHSCEREIVSNIPKYLGETNAAFNAYLKDEVEKIIDSRHFEKTGHDVLDNAISMGISSAGELLTNDVANLSTDNAAAKTYLKVVEKVAGTDFVRERTVKMIEETIGEKVLMDKELGEELMSVKIEDLLESGVINTILEKHVHKFFGGFKSSVLLLFLLGISIPIAEIILANYWERKRLTADFGPQDGLPIKNDIQQSL